MWKSLFEKGITAGFSYVCLWLSGMGSVLFYQSAFGGQTEWSHVESTFLVLSIILWCWYYFRKKLRIPAVLIHGGTAVVFLFAYLRNQEEIFAGLKLLANSVIEKWNYYYETGFWIFETGESGQEAMEITLLFLAMLIFWWGTVSLVCWKKVELLLLPGTLLFLLDLLVGYAPELKPMLFFLLGGIGSLPLCLRTGKKEPISAVGSLVLMLGIGCSLFFAEFFAGEYTKFASEKKMEILAYQWKLEERMKESGLSALFQGNEKMVTNEEPEYQNEEVMEITMSAEPTENVYLRGFTADTYENGTWRNTAGADFDSVVAEPAGLEPGTVERLIGSQLYRSVKDSSEKGQVLYEVQYLDFWDKYAYLPYCVNLDSVQGEKKEITFAWDSHVLRNRNKKLVAEGILTQYRKNIAQEKSNVNLSKEEYQTAMSAYESYREKYLAVPENLFRIKELTEELMKPYPLQEIPEEKLRAELAVDIVKAVLFDNTEYSLKLEELPEGVDVTEYFLFDSRKGFCQHYATTGALLLREMGIPARYVTGYKVSARNFSKQPDGTYKAVVLDSDAHAWVEIYVTGIGWIPEEMTKGVYSGERREWSAELGITDENVAESEVTEEQEVPADSETEQPETEVSEIKEEPEQPEVKPEEGNGAQQDGQESKLETGTAGSSKNAVVRNTKKWWLWCGVAGILVLCSGTALLLWNRKNETEQLISRQKNPRKQVQVLAARVYDMLRKKKILRTKYPDDRELKEILEKTGIFEEAELERYFAVTQRAAFDCAEIDLEEVKFCYDFYNKLKLLK